MPSVSGKTRKGKMLTVPDSHGLAWVAGVFCGEGSCTVHKIREHVGIRLTVGQSSLDDKCPEMLTKMKNILGVGRIYKMEYKKHAHHKTIWQYYVHNHSDVQALIAFMWNWLTPEKKQQATSTLRTWQEARLQYAV